MLQFKHFHDHKLGYVDAVSPDVTGEDKRIFQTISAFRRTKDGETCFTYLPKDSKAYLLQASKDGIYEYSHGLAQNIADFKDTRIAEYIDQLERKPGSDLGTNGVLSAGKLPIRCREFGLSIARGMKPVFADAVHALLEGAGTVILVGSNVGDLIKYVKVILCLFPASYANTIGFSVCPSSLPSFLGDEENPCANAIRLIATDQNITAGDGRTVIDIDRYVPAESTLNSYAAAIRMHEDDLVKGAGERVNALVRACCPAFGSDGKLNREQLETIMSVYHFDCNRNPETAVSLLKAAVADTTSVITKFSVVDAIECLLSRGSLSEDAEESIREARKNGEVNELVTGVCGKYAFDKAVTCSQINDFDRDDAIEYVKSLEDDKLLDGAEEMKTAFASARNLNVLGIFSRAYSETKRNSFLNLISRYVHISKTYNYSRVEEVDFDLAILNVVSNYTDASFELTAAALLSCYALTVVSASGERAKTKKRIETLCSFINQNYPEASSSIAYILKLKSAIESMAGVCGEEVRGLDDFDFLPTAYIKALVDRADFSALLSIVGRVEFDINSYTALSISILDRLCDLEQVKKNVRDESDATEYEDFLTSYKNEIRNRHTSAVTEEIHAYLAEIKESVKLRRTILDYRCKFVVEEYNTLPYYEKVKIAKAIKNTHNIDKEYHVSSTRSNETERDDIQSALVSQDESVESFNERQRIAEIVIERLRAIGTGIRKIGKTSNPLYFLFAYLWSLFFSAISAALIVFLPMLSALLLDQNLEQKILEFVTVYHIGAIILVGLLNFIGYFFRWHNSRHDRKTSLRKSCGTTLLYGIVPVLVYVAAYLVAYTVL